MEMLDQGQNQTYLIQVLERLCLAIENLRKEDNELNVNIDTLKNKILYFKENEI